MKKKLFFFICIFFYTSSSVSFQNKDLSKNQLLCPSVLWGFEFISHNRVKVINTNLNKITRIDEYYYEVDLKLYYINIFSSKENIRDRVYSIELNSLRIDLWSMTGGGFTTREMFPKGYCKFTTDKNILSHIQTLKQSK